MGFDPRDLFAPTGGGTQTNLDPSQTQYINGQLFVRQVDTSDDEVAQYLGYPDAKAMHAARGEPDWEYPVQWVPGDDSTGASLLGTLLKFAASTSAAEALAGMGGGGGGTTVEGGPAAQATADSLSPVTGVTGGVGPTEAQLAMTTPELEAASAIPGYASAAGTGASTASKIANALKVGAAGVSGATKAAAANRGSENDFDLQNARLALQNNELGLQGYEANTSAQSAFQNELINRARLEQDQRATDLKNLFKQSTAMNPARSPFDTKGAPALSPEYLAAINNLATQAGSDLSKAPTYDASTMTAPTPQAPYTQPPFTLPTFRTPRTAEDIGNYLGPILAGIGGVLV